MTPQQTQIDQEHRKLYWAGFKPRRFRSIVKFARHLIWPLVRPFHYYQQAKLLKAANKVCLLQDALASIKDQSVKLKAETAALKGQIGKFEPIVACLRDEITRLANEQTALRCELAAARNQIAGIESNPRFSARGLMLTSSEFGIFLAKPGEVISDFAIGGGTWDSHVVEAARKAAQKRKGGAIDIGAHFGSTTMALATLFDRVYSFEPNGYNFKLLQANVLLNKLGHVSLFNNALYSHSASLSLGEGAKQEVPLPLNEHGEIDAAKSDNLGAYFFAENGSGLFEHAARTLDSYEFENISFIKIDVQGADGEVLMGALQTIQRCMPIVVFEWEDQLAVNFSVTLDVIKRELSALGYGLSVLKAHNEKQIDYIAQPAGAQ